jgi:ribosomal protein L18E
MIAILEQVPSPTEISFTIRLASLRFIAREHERPTWVAIAPDLHLPRGETGPLGLRREAIPVRSGHIMVGVGRPDP